MDFLKVKKAGKTRYEKPFKTQRVQNPCLKTPDPRLLLTNP